MVSYFSTVCHWPYDNCLDLLVVVKCGVRLLPILLVFNLIYRYANNSIVLVWKGNPLVFVKREYAYIHTGKRPNERVREREKDMTLIVDHKAYAFLFLINFSN